MVVPGMPSPGTSGAPGSPVTGSGTDVAVIGGGIVGLAVADAVATRGASVTVYERGVPGAAQSGGHTRIFRHAHDDPRLVALASDSRRGWRGWEERAGIELISGDGAVALGPAVHDRLPLLTGAEGVVARALEPDELADRLPLLAAYTGPAMVDETGGAIRAREAVRWLVGELDGPLVADEVLSLRTTGAGVEVRAGGVRSQHDAAVVCAGRGTPALARTLGLSLPVHQEAHLRCTFAVAADPPGRLATIQDGSGHFGEPATYGGPLAGNDRYVLGISDAVDVREDGSLPDPGGLAVLGARAGAYVRRALPGLDPVPVGHRHCWVTRLPWGEDGVAVWEAGPVWILAGNNLFKHAPALGGALADAALGGGLPDQLRPEATLGRPG